MPSDTLDVVAPLDADTVLGYLKTHPNFFQEHAEILPVLDIPHQSGNAVSLIERQVTVLRDKCESLERKLCDLIAVAHENEQLHQRVHSLVQEIISAESLGDVIALTTDCLHEHFRADDVRVVLIADPSEIIDDAPADATVRVAPDDPRLAAFDSLLAARRTACGPITDELRTLAFTGEQENLTSAALIPLVSGCRYGFLVLASEDAARFSDDVGVLFLDQLGDVLSRRLKMLPVAV